MMLSLWFGNRGTMRDVAGFNPARDAEAIRNALTGMGTDEKILVDILTGRSYPQRQMIVMQYKEATGQELKEALKSDLSGCLGHLLVALVTPPAFFDAEELKRAMEGSGTDEKVLIEILASRGNWQLKEISYAYYTMYKKSLGDDISSDTSGHFRKTLLSLTDGRRSESPIVDAHLAVNDAQVLYDAGEKMWGTDEDKFTEILCFSSILQLRYTFAEYHKLCGKNIEDSIRSEMSDDFGELLVAVVQCARNIPVFFAEKLREAMRGAGTDEFTLNRIMVSRSEIDLLDIRAEYKRLYGHSLYSAIESDTSGDYRTALLRICGGPD